MKTFVKSALATSLVAMGLASGSASAFTLFPSTILEDDDIERFIERAGGGGTLDVGDRLRAVITIPSIVNAAGGAGSYNVGGSTGLPELTGISEIEVIRKIDLAALGAGTGFIYHFGPSADFQTEVASWGFSNIPTFAAGSTSGTPIDYGQGVMAAFWKGDSGTALNIFSCANVAACEGAASDGSRWATAGFAGDKDVVWVASNVLSDQYSVIRNAAPTESLGTFNFRLEILDNNTGYAFSGQTYTGAVPTGGDGLIQVIGSGSIEGGGFLNPQTKLNNGFDARSDFQFGLAATPIPEPGSLALLGLAAFGFGVTARRARKS